MTKKLLIVESPAKAKTINQYLGNTYVVRASFGHVRDLPKSKIGVDIDKDFAPTYVVSSKSKKIIAELKKLAESSDEILLATDFDREGEAIAWHIAQLLKTKKPMRRVTFHEVTKPAIKEAVENPREILMDLVDAQQARRVLDRLVGYKLSPLLWKKVYRGLSAGRVQSVAVRLIVEREKEIKSFKSRQYFTIDGLGEKDKKTFGITLIDTKGKAPLEFAKEAEADKALKDLQKAELKVKSVEKTPMSLRAPAPFITSNLQQAAARVCGYSVKRTMMLAQNLYEGVDVAGEGTVALITYMRTDSYEMSPIAKNSIKELIKSQWGDKYIPDKSNIIAKKSKGAQEAHEAIRPTDAKITPAMLKDKISRDHWKLYDLIWRQAVASQMANAETENVTAILEGGKDKLLIAKGRELIFKGYLEALGTKEDFTILPELEQGESIKIKSIDKVEHNTEPPARYSEASLVKEMEKRGIGRPSTYAPTISTIIDRGYVTKQTGRLFPQAVATVVTDLLVENFGEIMDYNFTAKMEQELDDIAEGEKSYAGVLHDFYGPFSKLLEEKEDSIERGDLVTEETDLDCPKCHKKLVKQLGRFGEYYKCKTEDCGYTAPILDNMLTKDQQVVLEKELKVKCEKCGKDLMVRSGRFGPFISCTGYPDCKFTKPISVKAEVKCPDCGGDLVRKPTRRGKYFWGCANYPKCKTAFWDEPVNEKCDKCQSLKVKKNNSIICPVCKD